MSTKVHSCLESAKKNQFGHYYYFNICLHHFCIFIVYCALDSKISFIFTTVYKKILDPIFMVQVLKARDSIIETNGMGFLYLDKIVRYPGSTTTKYYLECQKFFYRLKMKFKFSLGIKRYLQESLRIDSL